MIEIMPPTTTLLFLIVLGHQTGTYVCPLVTESNIYTTSGPESQVLEDSAQDGSGSRPIDKGLRPLYLMARGFLDFLHPRSKGDWIDDPRFDRAFRDGDIGAGLDIIFEQIQSDWQFWAGHYLGFTIVITTGITFIVSMPIIGFVFCCCRIRGRCGAKPLRGTKKSDGLKRLMVAIALIIFTTLMAAGVVAMFMTNEVLRQQTSAEHNVRDASRFSPEMGLVPAFVSSLRRIETYIQQTFEDVKNAILAPINDQVALVRKQLLEFPDRVREKLKAFLDPREVFSAASSLSDSLREIRDGLAVVKGYIDALNEMQTRLNVSMVNSKMNILNALPPNCEASIDCGRLKNSIVNLNVTVDFSQSANASSQVSNIASMINDFQSLIEEGKAQMGRMSDSMLNGTREAIREKVNSYLSELDKELDVFRKDSAEAVAEGQSQIANALRLNETATFLLRTASPPVEKYGNFRYYVGIALSCILLFIIICIYFGLCFGVCGEPPGDGARFCNRGTGASCLMAGIAFTFVFASLLMFIAMLLFVFGGVSYTDICRPMIHEENKAVIKVGERVLASSLKDTRYNFTILSVLSDCEDNKAIYEALNLEEALNVMKILDETRNLITEKVNDLRGKIRLNYTSIVVAKQEIRDMLTRLSSVTVKDFPFSSYEFSLSKPITNSNVTSLARDLFELSRNPILNSTQRAAVALESSRLFNMSDWLIGPMMNKTREFREYIGKFKEKVVPRPGFSTFANKSQDLMNSLLSTQQFLQTNLSHKISEFLVVYIGDVASGSYEFLNDVKHAIQHNVGKCRAIYDIFRAVTVTTCSSFLSPFNGFWFSILWCLVLSVPSLVFSVLLIRMYRKTDDSIGYDSKSLDDPSQSLLRKGLNKPVNT